MNLFPIIFSTVTVYLAIVLAIRLFGKKELSQLSVIDLVFILLISNAVQNAMVGSDSSLAGGLAAAASLFVVNALFKWVLYRYPGISHLVQGEALLLIYQGQLNSQNLAKAQISHDEILEALREHGVESIDKVNLAVLEVDGNISILTNDYTQHSKRKRRTKTPAAQNNP